MKRVKSKKAKADSPKSVLITGASSGIGAAVAIRYAQRNANLMLWGRNTGRLQEVARLCEQRGANVACRSLDLRNGEEALAAFREDDDRLAFDLVVLSAGVGDIRQPGDRTENAETVLSVGLTNFSVPSALATVAAERMSGRSKGHIVFVGSVASFFDLPFGTAYSGSKAGLLRFASALRIAMLDYGVGVTTISPGFVDTPMSQRLKGARPFLVSPKKAATLIADAVEKNLAHAIFPWPFRVLRVLGVVLPAGVRTKIMRNIKAEQASVAGR